MAEWSACQICNRGVLGSRPTLTTTWIILFHSCPEFKSSAMLVNSQLTCLLPAGILNNVMFSLNNLVKLFAWPE